MSSTGSFICAISIGTLIMELQALQQCLEGVTTELKVFRELQQSIYFIYATMNEDIYATLCVDCTQRICVKTKSKKLHAYFICFMKKYVCKKYCTWYFKKMFLLCLGFPPELKSFKKADCRYYEIWTGNKSWDVSINGLHVLWWVQDTTFSSHRHCL